MKSKYYILNLTILMLLICQKSKSQHIIVNNEKDTLIPFTSEIFKKIRDEYMDVRQFQFFNNNTIELIPPNQTYYSKGNIIKHNDTPSVIINTLTPCILQEIRSLNLLRIAFERNGYLEFENTNGFYQLVTTKNKKDENIVVYKDISYKIICPTCNDTLSMILFVRKKDLEIKTVEKILIH